MDDWRALEGAYPVDAPAEVVYGTLSDPERIARWLPQGIVAERQGADREGVERFRVRAGSRSAEFRVAMDADHLRMAWSPLGGPGPSGVAQVRETPAGASTVEVKLRVPADMIAEDRARELIDESADRLRRDVENNFNPG